MEHLQQSRIWLNDRDSIMLKVFSINGGILRKHLQKFQFRPYLFQADSLWNGIQDSYSNVFLKAFEN